MSLVAVLLLLTGQPSSGTTSIPVLQPFSGGIPTTPPPPRPSPILILPTPRG